MAVTLSDQYLLSTDSGFQNRVRTAMVSGAIAVKNEGWSVLFHREREAYAVGIINAPDSFKQIFANSVATDASVIGDATQGGTVALTVGNLAAQAALVTDAHINTALASQFTSFFRTPGHP